MNIETKPDFWSVINEADNCVIELERALDLFNLFEEHLDREVGSLDVEKPWSITCVKNRYTMIGSLLETINMLVCDVITSLNNAVDNGTKICREIRQQSNNK